MAKLPPHPDEVFWYKRKPAIARAGMMGLSLEAKAVYGILIDLCYERRGPLEDNDAVLAHQCETDVRRYRRLKAELLAKDRIKIDEEAGTLFDERVIRELVRAELYSESQAKRARKRGGNVVKLVVHANPMLQDNGLAKPELGGDATRSYGVISPPKMNKIKGPRPARRKEKNKEDAAAQKLDRKAWLADQAARMGLAKQEGKDGDGVEAPGDRKARRRKR